jgi:hypothetical protein
MDEEQRETQQLRELFNSPKVPDDLAGKLKANLEAQIGELKPVVGKSPSHRKWYYSMAASLTLAIVVALQFQSKPDLVSLAYAHSQEETHLVGAMDGGFESWFKTTGLQIPSQADHIVLSKTCTLGKQKAKHLRFDFPNEGTINLFLYKNEEDLPETVQADGTIDGQFWLSLNPREDLHLLALYDANVSKAQITQIIKSMFENYSA